MVRRSNPSLCTRRHQAPPGPQPMRNPPLVRESCPFDGTTRPPGSRDIGSPGAPGAPGAPGVMPAGAGRLGPWRLAGLGGVDEHVGLQRKPSDSLATPTTTLAAPATMTVRRVAWCP